LEKEGLTMPELDIWKKQHLNRLKQDMDRLFDQVWGEFGRSHTPRYIGNIPFVDRIETEKHLIIRAEIPGIIPKDLDIVVTDNTLTIKGETQQKTEKKGKGFFKDLDKKVREDGFALVDMQVGQIKRPEVVPLVDGNPTHLDQLEEMVEKGRFPKDEFEEMKKKQAELRDEIDNIFLELRDLQKEIQQNAEEMDRLMFMKMATELAGPIKAKYKTHRINAYLDNMVEDMGDNLQIFASQSQQSIPGLPFALAPQTDAFQPYQINQLVDNEDLQGPPVIVESYPTYRNLFGSIERVVDLSGSTHNKGVLILSGYLREKYAQDKPLTMSASIAFEQSYGGVDGDSASSTEIYALLSSLSGVPIKQNIAVTGSVNQKGEVQAIGGVNQKIEGFYGCCKKIGLTGKQGVMIPESNVQDPMLRKDVVEAVKQGKFHVYSVRNVDQGIEILTGKKSGELKKEGTYPKDTMNALVNERLKKLAEGIKKFGEEEKGNQKKKGRKR
jgi:predicted ATP-dependent protease/HSP20 family molecular chaperone IbpA